MQGGWFLSFLHFLIPDLRLLEFFFIPKTNCVIIFEPYPHSRHLFILNNAVLNPLELFKFIKVWLIVLNKTLLYSLEFFQLIEVVSISYWLAAWFLRRAFIRSFGFRIWVITKVGIVSRRLEYTWVFYILRVGSLLFLFAILFFPKTWSWWLFFLHVVVKFRVQFLITLICLKVRLLLFLWQLIQKLGLFVLTFSPHTFLWSIPFGRISSLRWCMRVFTISSNLTDYLFSWGISKHHIIVSVRWWLEV